MNYVIHFIDGAQPRDPMLVGDVEFLPRDGDILCITDGDQRSYTRWIVHNVVHTVAFEGALSMRRVAAPPNVHVRTAPKTS